MSAGELQVVEHFRAAACTPRGTCMQTLRTSRWARIASTVAVIKNVGTPMSFSRVIVLGASFVCSVLNTRWPVSDACTAISAVSRSRISPTRILSGSCRKMDRRHVGERIADRGVDRHLDDALHVVLDRVLGRDQLVFDAVQLVEGRVERRRLAGAGRAGDQHDAVGLVDRVAELSPASRRSCRPWPGRATRPSDRAPA